MEEQQATVISLEQGCEKGNKKVEQQATVISFEQGWETIQKGIKKVKDILEGVDDEVRFSSEEYMPLYTAAYNLCIQRPPHDYTGQLYDKYRESLEDYITSTVLPSFREQHDEFMLRVLVRRWANHKVMVKWSSRFFQYIERYYVPRRSLPTLNDVGLACFRELVYEKIKVKARDVVVFLIGQEREGKQINRALLKNVVEIFVDMGVDRYEDDLEDAILREAAAFYSWRASCWILEDSCPVYMLKAEDCLKLEKDRVSHYLRSSSEPKLLKIMHTELISVYAAQLLEMEDSGCSALLQKNEVNNLSLMYRLFSKVDNGLVPVSSKFKQHITAEGMAVVNQAEDIASKKKTENKEDVVSLFFVQKTTELHDKYLEYVHECFQNHAQFHKALREALDVICNKTVAGLSSAELFAAFCDCILQKGGRREKLSDEAIEETMENMANLVLFISDKDLFSEFCRKKLAKRLLCDKGADADHERSLLSKLKRQCGGQFTSKMECMLNDLTLSREIQVSFREYLHSNPCAKPSTSFTATVLTSGCWPSYKSSNLNLPAEMVKCVEAFGDYYQMGTNCRKLTWIYSLGNCILNGKFRHKTIEMVATTHQALVLLLFNDSDRLCYSEIMSQLNLTDDEIVRLLHSLCFARYNILNKEPNTKSISPTDYFEINSDFTDKSRRIKLPHPPVDEKKKVIEDVGKERVYSIDASLVRVMKSRKVLSHQQLVIECVQQLSSNFKPDVKTIKKQIDNLILREFLERDKENPNLYKYLA